MIWFKKHNVESINNFSVGTMASALGIVFTEIGDDYLKATMPVDSRTVQPDRLLHGGASVALAETIGSVGAHLTIDPEKYQCVGLEINANHIKAKKDGIVTGTGKPIHRGRTTQVWEINITDEQKKLVCISRITVAVLQKGI